MSPDEQGASDSSCGTRATGGWFARPPRVWQLVWLARICALVAYAASFPGGVKQMVMGGGGVRLFLGACLIWPMGIVLLGVDYLARLAVWVRKRCFTIRDWRWGTTGVLLIATLVAWRTDWLLRWRFAANRAALGDVAVALLATAAPPSEREHCDLDWPFAAFAPFGRPVGDYHVYEVAVFPTEQVVFFRTGGFFRSGWGFLYDPHGRVTSALLRAQSVEGAWSTFEYAKE